MRSGPVIWGLAIIGNRLRLRSVEIWPKNRTGPDFQTLSREQENRLIGRHGLGADWDDGRAKHPDHQSVPDYTSAFKSAHRRYVILFIYLLFLISDHSPSPPPRQAQDVDQHSNETSGNRDGGLGGPVAPDNSTEKHLPPVVDSQGNISGMVPNKEQGKSFQKINTPTF